MTTGMIFEYTMVRINSCGFPVFSLCLVDKFNCIVSMKRIELDEHE